MKNSPFLLATAVNVAKERFGFTHWGDERALAIPLDKFEAVFPSKYCPNGRLCDWSFSLTTEENPCIKAQNTLGFKFVFPLITIKVDGNNGGFGLK